MMQKIRSSSCSVCGKENISFNEIGLCRKLINRNIEKFMCINCLAEYLEITVEELEAKIEEFKGQGCILFK